MAEGTTTTWPTPGSMVLSHPGHTYRLRAWYGWIGLTISPMADASPPGLSWLIMAARLGSRCVDSIHLRHRKPVR